MESKRRLWVKKVGGGTSVQTRDKQYDRGQQKTGRWEAVDGIGG